MSEQWSVCGSQQMPLCQRIYWKLLWERLVCVCVCIMYACERMPPLCMPSLWIKILAVCCVCSSDHPLCSTLPTRSHLQSSQYLYLSRGHCWPALWKTVSMSNSNSSYRDHNLHQVCQSSAHDSLSFLSLNSTLQFKEPLSNIRFSICSICH